MQTPVPVALRVAVVGGGCSGFQYHMAFENATSEADEVVDFITGMEGGRRPDELRRVPRRRGNRLHRDAGRRRVQV